MNVLGEQTNWNLSDFIESMKTNESFVGVERMSN